MDNFASQISEFAGLFILGGAFIDVFFATGYIFYGFALMTAVTMLHAMGKVTILEIIIVAYIGTLLASYVNYAIGYFFGNTTQMQKLLRGQRGQQITKRLQGQGLFFVMFICRFVTLLRPLYMLILGIAHIDTKRVFWIEAVNALVWVVFWVIVLVAGEEIIMRTTKFLLSVV